MKRLKRLKGLKGLSLASLVSLASLAAFAEKVEIWSAADWDHFATRVNSGEFGLDAVMMRNVTLTSSSPRCGISKNRYYGGKFDGNGKTLTVNINLTNAGEDNPASPFAYFISDTNIHDLHVAGRIQTDGKFSSGILGKSVYAKSGTAQIARCRVSVAITSTRSGDGTSGGLVACVNDPYPDVSITDSVFDGSFKGDNVDCVGGLVGWRYSNSYISLANCLFNPSSFTSKSASKEKTLIRPGFYADKHNTNNWYTFLFGEAQGNDGRGKTAAQLVESLGSNWKVVDDKPVPKMTVSVESQASGTSGFTYHGSLRDVQGNALSVLSHTIAFRIYSQATGGSAHWGRKQVVMLDADGNFAVPISDEDGEALGDGTPGTELEEVLSNNAGTTLFLGLTVDGGSAELSPRQKLIASPYATCALDGGAASGNMSVAGEVLGESLSVSGTVAAGSINTEDKLSFSSLKTTGNGTVSGNLTVKGALSGNGAFPIGGIMIWSGSKDNLPPGFALCDGSVAFGRRTPDLRNRFIVGAGSSYSVGSTGGADTVTLNEAQIPSHQHTWVGDDALNGRDAWWFNAKWNTATAYDADSSHSRGGGYVYGTSYVGGNKAHENLPPYYALCYIMRVK